MAQHRGRIAVHADRAEAAAPRERDIQKARFLPKGGIWMHGIAFGSRYAQSAAESNSKLKAIMAGNPLAARVDPVVLIFCK